LGIPLTDSDLTVESGGMERKNKSLLQNFAPGHQPEWAIFLSRDRALIGSIFLFMIGNIGLLTHLILGKFIKFSNTNDHRNSQGNPHAAAWID
jgi:hypothetical protein